MENTEKKLIPTSDWMKINYDKLNKELFDGKLGDCILRPFTSGKGSNGGTLGWFKITGSNIKVERSSRRMYQNNRFYYLGWHDKKTYINANNFVDICKPAIELNANYAWSEKAMLSTLLHEMCHYYTYMGGYAPKQGHGPEFYSIGRYVSEKSKGTFPVERLASAEEMKEIEFTQDFLDKIKAKTNKNGTKLIVFTFNSPVESTTGKLYDCGYCKLQTPAALKKWKDYLGYASLRKECNNVIVFNCNNLNKWSQISRCNLGNYFLTNVINEKLEDLGATFDEYLIQNEGEQIIDSKFLSKKEEPKNNAQARQLSFDFDANDKKTHKQPIQLSFDFADDDTDNGNNNTNIIPIFRLKLGNKQAGTMINNNNTFELRNTTKEEIEMKLKERFPNMKPEAIQKLIDNPTNYPTNESRNIQQIIENVINNYLTEAIYEDDSIEITSDMNLGEYSPLEIA